MTNEEASCVLHCPDAYGGIYGQKYGEALAHCFELLEKVDNLDNIRAEIDRQQKWLLHVGYTPYKVDMAFNAIKSVAESGEIKCRE